MVLLKIFFLALAAVASQTSSARAGMIGSRSSSVVTIANGTITGIDDTESGVQKFLGIPFAQPPVGRLRLRQAVSLNSSLGAFDASTFGYSCWGATRQPNCSEDCLTLNIWRPSDVVAETKALAVMVFFYGGGLSGGYTSAPGIEGSNMVRISVEIGKPVIVITVNYRLSSLGFLNGKQMAELGLLNIGMLDQRLAMHWIRENIGAFGGDPDKVTLFGQSAGAVSIYSHMMAYGGRDDKLFRGAILQSGGAFPLTYPNTTAFQTTFDSLINKTNCSDLAAASASEQLDCIRSLPIDVFKSSVGGSTGQAIDGDFTRTSIQFALPAGQYIKIATMVGANTDEGTTSAPTGINTSEQLSEPLADGFHRPRRLPDETVKGLLALYPEAPQLGCPYNTGTAAISKGRFDKQACSIFGDLVQIAPARMIATNLAKDGVPVYRYRFNHFPYNSSAVSKGIGTGAELNYVFSNQVPSSPWDRSLAYEVTSAWVSFAWGLDPNPGSNSSLPCWPQYGKEANSIVFNGYGSYIEKDTYRQQGMQYIIDNVLPDGAS